MKIKKSEDEIIRLVAEDKYPIESQNETYTDTDDINLVVGKREGYIQASYDYIDKSCRMFCFYSCCCYMDGCCGKNNCNKYKAFREDMVYGGNRKFNED